MQVTACQVGSVLKARGSLRVFYSFLLPLSLLQSNDLDFRLYSSKICEAKVEPRAETDTPRGAIRGEIKGKPRLSPYKLYRERGAKPLIARRRSRSRAAHHMTAHRWDVLSESATAIVARCVSWRRHCSTLSRHCSTPASRSAGPRNQTKHRPPGTNGTEQAVFCT